MFVLAFGACSDSPDGDDGADDDNVAAIERLSSELLLPASVFPEGWTTEIMDLPEMGAVCGNPVSLPESLRAVSGVARATTDTSTGTGSIAQFVTRSMSVDEAAVAFADLTRAFDCTEWTDSAPAGGVESKWTVDAGSVQSTPDRFFLSARSSTAGVEALRLSAGVIRVEQFITLILAVNISRLDAATLTRELLDTAAARLRAAVEQGPGGAG